MSKKFKSLKDLIDEYHEKNRLLIHSDYGMELNPWSYFEEVFWRGDHSDYELEQCDEHKAWRDGLPYQDDQRYRYNPLAVELVKKSDGEGLKQGRRWVIFEGVDRDPISELMDGEFVITSPLTYVGRTRTASNARYCYGYAIDLDGVGIQQLSDLIYQMRTGFLPWASMIVNSGTGMHVYYLFKEPIALFKNIAEVLQKQKKGLIDKVWNFATSTLADTQFLGIYQGFRVPGTPTKLSKDIKVRCFKGPTMRYTVGELDEYVDDHRKLDKWEINLAEKAIFKADRLTKRQAKALYPEWYERVIERGDRSKGRWVCHRGLYDWWKQRFYKREIKVGHRYFGLVALAMYAKKCNIPYEELEKDMFYFLDPLDRMTESEDNHFTEDDVYDALKSYKDDYCYISRANIQRITGVVIPAGKRNYRKRDVHLYLARAQQEALGKLDGKDWREGNGRPKGSVISAEDSPQYAKVQEWRKNNPKSSNKSLCARECGLSRPTVIKWWNAKIERKKVHIIP